MIKPLTMLLPLLLLASCGTAWIIESDAGGGKIGYKGFRDGESANEAITKLINCPYYESVSDRLVSGETRTAYMPVQNTSYSNGTLYNRYGTVSYNGQQTQTNYVPYSVTDHWREYSYRCKSEYSNHEINQTVKNRSSASVSCEENCKIMLLNNELRVGIDYKACLKHMCNN